MNALLLVPGRWPQDEGTLVPGVHWCDRSGPFGTSKVIVLVFSTLMYVVEPTDNIDSFGTAMWICTVTVTTVGYGDVTPSTNSGKILAGALCFISVLFMAMPISVLGNVA